MSWYIRLLKKKYIIAGLIIAAGIAITPVLVHVAYEERGYKAIGGEFAPLLMSLVLALFIINLFGKLEVEYKKRIREQRLRGVLIRYVGKMRLHNHLRSETYDKMRFMRKAD